MIRKSKQKKLYLLDSEIKWKPFKKLHDSIVKDSGPTPKHGTKILWEMLRDKKILCWFQKEDWLDDMGVGLEVPKGYEVHVIKNG